MLALPAPAPTGSSALTVFSFFNERTTKPLTNEEFAGFWSTLTVAEKQTFTAEARETWHTS